MKNSNITEPDDPFGVFLKLFEIDAIDDPRHAISSPCAKDRFYFIVIEHLLKIIQSFFVCT